MRNRPIKQGFLGNTSVSVNSGNSSFLRLRIWGSGVRIPPSAPPGKVQNVPPAYRARRPSERFAGAGGTTASSRRLSVAKQLAKCQRAGTTEDRSNEEQASNQRGR